MQGKSVDLGGRRIIKKASARDEGLVSVAFHGISTSRGDMPLIFLSSYLLPAPTIIKTVTDCAPDMGAVITRRPLSRIVLS